MNTEEIFRKTVKSTNAARLSLIKEVMATLEKKKISLQTDAFETYLVLDEATLNAMEHGNCWVAAKEVTLTISVVDKLVKITILDEGNGFDPEKLPETTDFLGKKISRGKGISIIKTLAGANWNQTGNEITLQFSQKEQASPEKAAVASFISDGDIMAQNTIQISENDDTIHIKIAQTRIDGLNPIMDSLNEHKIKPELFNSVIFDLNSVQYINSLGLAEIMAVLRFMNIEEKTDLKIIFDKVDKSVARILKIMQLQDFAEILEKN